MLRAHRAPVALPSLAAAALAGLAAAGLLAAPAARAQTFGLADQARRAPAGIAVPNASIAGAEEATALAVNPAGVGFLDGFALQYLHEGRGATSRAGDGFWLAAPLGNFVPALAMQWMRPEEGGGPRFRKTTLGLAVAGGQSASLAVAWNLFSSPQRDLGRLTSLDAGLTLRPSRHLSLGVTALGVNASLAGRSLPVRYGAGAATRFLHDALTLSGDLLFSDRVQSALGLEAGVLGASWEIGRTGLALGGQLQLPIEARNRCGGCAAQPATFGLLTLAWNSPHAGVVTGGGGGEGTDRHWLVGARVSAERYRSLPAGGSDVPAIDLADALSRGRALFGSDRDLYGELVRRLARARDEDAAPALAVRIDSLPIGHGRVEELRSLLLEVKARKPVLAYLVGGGMKEYYLATAASAVVAPAASALFPSGLSSSTPFVKEALGKIGVGFDVVAIGAYKNAPDPLVRGDMSPAQREVADRILDDVYARETRGIAAARGLDEARVRELVDVGIFSAEEARAARLIDGTAWPDELDGVASRLVGRRVRLGGRLDAVRERGAQRWGGRPAVAVIRVEGAIAQGKSRGDPLGGGAIAGAETISGLVRRAARDDAVAAIVLRVDSPGGDGLASDLVWREVVQARRRGKPVVASMGDLAASGGYLVAVGADLVVAEPSTLTGSIGVFAVKPDVSALLRKVGVNEVTLRRGRHADLLSLSRPWTDEERALVRRQVAGFYDLFVARVAEGRRLERAQVEAVAQGQVWTGAQALERRLVDALGSFEDAVRLAKERAGFDRDADVELRAFEPERGFLSDLTGGLAGRSPELELLGRVPELRAALLLLEMGTLVALPPGWIGDGDAAGR